MEDDEINQQSDATAARAQWALAWFTAVLAGFAAGVLLGISFAVHPANTVWILRGCAAVCGVWFLGAIVQAERIRRLSLRA